MSDWIDTRDVFTKRELLAEIDRLHAELTSIREARWQENMSLLRAEARLAAVIALCDKYDSWPGMPTWSMAAEVRAAATGTPCA